MRLVWELITRYASPRHDKLVVYYFHEDPNDLDYDLLKKGQHDGWPPPVLGYLYF